MRGHKGVGSLSQPVRRPVAFPEDGIRAQGKAVGTKTPPTALLFWLLPQGRSPRSLVDAVCSIKVFRAGQKYPDACAQRVPRTPKPRTTCYAYRLYESLVLGGT